MKARTEQWLREVGQGKGGRDTSDQFDESRGDRRNHRQSEVQSPTWGGINRETEGVALFRFFKTRNVSA